MCCGPVITLTNPVQRDTLQPMGWKRSRHARLCRGLLHDLGRGAVSERVGTSADVPAIRTLHGRWVLSRVSRPPCAPPRT